MGPRTASSLNAHHSPHLVLEHLAVLANARRTGRYLRIPCPAHGGTNPNLALWVNDDSIGAKCHSAGCSYADITNAIADRFGISIARHHHQERRHRSLATSSNRPSAPATTSSTDLRSYALRLWQQSTPIPKAPEHPGRKWLAARHLWRPELPLPATVRWTGTQQLHREFTGAGAITTLAAPPAAWLRAWPALPEPTCVHLVFCRRRRQPHHRPRTHQENLRQHPGRGRGTGMPSPGAGYRSCRRR